MAELDLEPFKSSDFLSSQCIEDFFSLMALEEAKSPELDKYKVPAEQKKFTDPFYAV